jgi:hypothetical protein
MLAKNGMCPVQGVSTRSLGLKESPFIRWGRALIVAEFIVKTKSDHTKSSWLFGSPESN